MTGESERIVELEIQVAHQQHYLEEINQELVRTGLELESLKIQFQRLQSMLRSSGLDFKADPPSAEA